jgi:hypothetical protein
MVSPPYVRRGCNLGAGDPKVLLTVSSNTLKRLSNQHGALCIRARPVLPTLLDQEIDGVSFILKCAFLTEHGYANLSKANVYIKDFLQAI